MSFVYIINKPLEKVQIGENVNQKILREYLLDHLEIEICPRHATLNRVKYAGGDCTLISPNWKTGPAPATISDELTFLTFPLQDGRVVHVGYREDEPPTSEDFERFGSGIGGYKMRDTVDQEWLIPVARSPRGNETLPTDIQFDLTTSQIKRTRQPRFDALWDLANQVWDEWNKGDKKANDDFLANAALLALQVNYRISRLELNALQQMGRSVLNDVTAATASQILIDFELVKQHNAAEDDAKKNTVPS